jgi:anti-anti-sigma factor
LFGRFEAVVASPDFVCSQQLVEGVLVVRLSGELDMSTWDELCRRLHEVACSAEVANVVLDLSGVGFIDAHSAGLIMAAEAKARVHGRVLRVDGLHDLPALVFNLLGLDHLVARPVPEKR